VTQGWRHGLLLPSAAGKDWSGALFLKHAWLAAGLPARAHLEPDARVEVFEVEEFGE
jgi:AMMECR1 domain-containing protein